MVQNTQTVPFGPTLVVALSLAALVPAFSSAQEPWGDGNPPAEPLAPPPTTPVALALDRVPDCTEGEGPVDWYEVFSGVSVGVLLLAVDEGEVPLSYLDAVAAGVAALGDGDDLTALWQLADSAAWNYVGDLAGEDATQEDVLREHLRVAGSLRRDVLRAWNAEHDVAASPVLSLALWDDDLRVQRTAVRYALASNDETLVAEATEVCDAVATVKGVVDECPP